VPDDLPVGQPHDGMEHRAHARLEMSREISCRRSDSTLARSTRLLSMASATACWMERSLRTMGSLWMRAWPGGEVEGAQHARGRRGLDARAQRGQQAVATGGAGRLASGHEDEEAVRAHGVQGRRRPAGPSSPPARREASTAANSRTARRRRPSRAWSPVRPIVRGRRR
jgi:hypothetical protein